MGGRLDESTTRAATTATAAAATAAARACVCACTRTHSVRERVRGPTGAVKVSAARLQCACGGGTVLYMFISAFSPICVNGCIPLGYCVAVLYVYFAPRKRKEAQV